MRVLLDGVTLMGITIHPANDARFKSIMEAPVQVEGGQMPPMLVDAVAGLWQDQGVREAFNRRNELQLNDSAP
jgi:guanine nucleotide-binding protein subunit alpha